MKNKRSKHEIEAAIVQSSVDVWGDIDFEFIRKEKEKQKRDIMADIY